MTTPTPQSIINVLTTSFTLYRKAYTALLNLVFAFALVKALPIFAALLMANALGNFIILLLAVVSMLVIIYLNAALVFRIQGFYFETPKTNQEALTVAKAKYVRLLTVTVLSTILIAAGLMLFVIPGIFLFVLLLFVIPIVLFEDQAIIASIKRSALLVWGNWWRTFAVFALASIPVFILGLILSLVKGPEAYWLDIIMDIALDVIVLPFILSVLIVQFYDLCAREKAKPVQSTNEPQSPPPTQPME